MRAMMLGMLATAVMPVAAWAQQAPAPATPANPVAQPASGDEEDEAPDIVVTGARAQPGAVIGDIPPDQQLSPADIRSYGVSSVSDLLNELAPQTRSGVGGAPVILLNGRRISGFGEIRDIPTEAILRVDILPEEVALKYGYSADQKVVNFVLRRRFRAITAEAADTAATEGGRNAVQGDLDVLHIQRDTRVNVHVKMQGSSALTEAERDITAPPSTATPAVDQRPYRTLLPSTRTLSVNTIYARPIGTVSATINAEIGATSSNGTQGLPTVALAVPTGNPFGDPQTVTRVLTDGFAPLAQRSSGRTAHLGSTLNGQISPKWRWTLTGSYDWANTETFTDTRVDAAAFQSRLTANDPTANPFGTLGIGDIGPAPGNRAFSSSRDGQVDALVNGPLFALPAGDVSTSIKVGGETSDFSSNSYRFGAAQTGRVSRDIGNGRVNIDLPITSRSKGVLGAIGTLSLNGNFGVDQLSDFGTLKTIGYGANWSPIDGIRVIGSVSDKDEAPTQQQLGNPQVVTPNVRIFDYVAGTTATVTSTSGGNPLLRADNRHTDRIGLTLKPWSKRDLSFTASYVTQRTNDPIAAFPTPTAAIEKAFPGRFTRDTAGNLLTIDTRPINFARTESSSLRWGIDFSKPIKSKIQKQLEAFRAGTGPNPFEGMTPPGGFPRRDGAQGGGGDTPPRAGGGDGPRAGGPGGGGGFRGGGFGGGGRGGQGGGRIQFALYHTWHFTDRVVIADGGRTLDLLNGDSIGANGGSPRHEVEAQAGYSNNGIGARLSANWQSATHVNGGTAAAPQTLNFGSLGTADLRLFADLGQRLEWVKAHPWLRGTRITFAVTNLLNTRQRVTDATGATPIGYQPGYLDPLGRTVRVSIRKLFF